MERNMYYKIDIENNQYIHIMKQKQKITNKRTTYTCLFSG